MIQFILLFILSQTVSANTTFRLKNGTKLESTDAPYFAMLNIGIGGRCSSQLVGPKTILTAAHCCAASAPAAYAVKLNGVEQVQSVSSIHINPLHVNLSSPSPHDMCILVLSSEVQAVQPLSLVENKDEIFTADLVEMGFTPPTLLSTDDSSYGYFNFMKLYSTDRFMGFIAGSGGGRPGDSGGAFLARSPVDQSVKLAGVTSAMVQNQALKSSCTDPSSATHINLTVVAGTGASLKSECFSDVDAASQALEKNKAEFDALGMAIEQITFPFDDMATMFAPIDANLDFIESTIQQTGIEICGINKNCDPVYFER